MGLDIFLYRERYVRGEKAQEIKELVGEKSPSESVSVKTEVAYWRKANFVHKFFCDYMEAEEDRMEFWVSTESLQELLKRCEEIKNKVELVDGKVEDGWTMDANGKKTTFFRDGKIIKNPAICKKLLPTQDGFFFGSTEYDEDYMYQIDLTIDQLKQVLSNDTSADDYYYSCSY